MLDVLQRACLQVVDADHPVPVGDERVAEVRTEKTRTARHYRRRHTRMLHGRQSEINRTFGLSAGRRGSGMTQSCFADVELVEPPLRPPVGSFEGSQGRSVCQSLSHVSRRSVVRSKRDEHQARALVLEAWVRELLPAAVAAAVYLSGGGGCRAIPVCSLDRNVACVAPNPEPSARVRRLWRLESRGNDARSSAATGS